MYERCQVNYLHVDLIISVDMASTWCIPKAFCRGLPHEPLGIHTEWGWTFIGGEVPYASIISNYLIRMDRDIIAEKLDKIFAEDFKSIPGDHEVEKLSREEHRALVAIEQSIQLQDKRYIASAPWKYDREKTFQMMSRIDSRKTAEKRL